MAVGKNREELYELFKTGAKPSGADFKDLIDSSINSSDDGIEKPLGDDTPLKISARGSTENLLDFYAGETLTWRINQKPTPDLPGLNFETATGNSSKLFIDSATGKVGLSTTTPTAKLHIQHNSSGDALRIDDQTQDTTPLVVDAEGKVGIGNANPSVLLDVNGETAISGPLSVTETTQLTGNVGIGNAAQGSHKLTVFDSDLALQVSKNTNSQGLLFQNSDGAYTWRIYRESVGSDKADLKIAGGKKTDHTKLTEFASVKNNGTFKLRKLQLGDKCLLSGVGDGRSNDSWIRLMDVSNSNYYDGGIAAKKLWCEELQFKAAKFKESSHKPFELKQFTGEDNMDLNTDYDSRHWVVIIAGVYLTSDGKSNGQFTFTYVRNNKWYIRADVRGPSDTWKINVLAIKKNWVHVISQIPKI